MKPNAQAQGLTRTSEGGDIYIAKMSNGIEFSVGQEDWSVKTDYYLEALVYHLPDLVQNVSATGNGLKRVLELGVARGVLSIGVALLTGDETRIVGIDIEPRSRKLVAENAVANGVGHKIEVRIGDLFEPLDPGETFDLVLGELPFIPVDPVLQEMYIRHGHSSEILNVSGGPDGRYFVDALVSQGAAFVREGGALILVQPSFIGVDQTIDLMDEYGFDGRVAVGRKWLLGNTKFTQSSRGYIERLYPSAFHLNADQEVEFEVVIVVGTKRA